METRMKLRCRGLAISVTAWLLLFVAEATATHEEYFPLAVGNSWTYISAHDSSTLTFTIIGTAEIMGKTYYIFDDYFNVSGFGGSVTVGGAVFLRYDPIERKLLRYVDGGEIIRYDLSGGPQDAACTVPAGVFSQCFHFHFIPLDCCNSLVGEYLAPYVGNVKHAKPAGSCCGGSPPHEGDYEMYLLQSYNITLIPEPAIMQSNDYADTFVISWYSQQKYKYRLWESSGLTNWTPSGNWQTGTNDFINCSKSSMGFNKMFYKVEYQLLP